MFSCSGEGYEEGGDFFVQVGVYLGGAEENGGEDADEKETHTLIEINKEAADDK